jgi:hypothetical protein
MFYKISNRLLFRMERNKIAKKLLKVPFLQVSFYLQKKDYFLSLFLEIKKHSQTQVRTCKNLHLILKATQMRTSRY